MGRADETYLDEPYLSIRWRGIPQILYAEWKGFATSDEYRAALLTGVRAIRERHVVGYVSDARKAKLFLPQDLQWAKDVWLPQAEAAGLKRMAMVTADTGLGKVILEEAINEVDNPWSVHTKVQLGHGSDDLGPDRLDRAEARRSREPPS
jgi:hypothetical protein